VPLPLDGPWAKVDRAVEHLKALDLGCQIFLQTKPYYVSAEFEPDKARHAVLLRVRQPVPLALSVVVGDFLHDLRSALDQAAWLLACRSNPVAKLWQDNMARTISWPFLDDPGKLGDHGLGCRVADDARAVLDRAQPYQGTDRARSLERLDALWNIDKHRVVHGGFAVIDVSKVSFRPRAIHIEEFPSEAEWVFDPDKGAVDRTPIAYVTFPPPPEGKPTTAQVDVKGQPSAQIAFGSGGGGVAYTVGALAQIVTHVGDTLSEVAALPEQPPP
jgi:hypothetical protein